jgi:hypothetical protein
MNNPANRVAAFGAKSSRSTSHEADSRAELGAYFDESPGANADKLDAFPKYIRRQSLARVLALQDLFRMVLDVPGDVMECGVHLGGGLMTFAQMSAVLEPMNLQRRVIGFDTFSGFPTVSDADRIGARENATLHIGGYRADSLGDLDRCISLYDANRPIGHIEKVVLVKGDAVKTIPAFLDSNPHTIVSLLHLDFDLYEPTRAALNGFVPRMPKGAVIVFDEINHPAWPGETLAVVDALGIPKLRLKRFTFEPHISYAVVE